MRLYYSPGACATASHIAALELGLDLEYVRVDLATKQTDDGRNFKTINPLGYVPVLELDDGTLITENVAILSYLDALSPLGTNQADLMARTQLIEILSFLSSELHKAFGPFFGPLDEAALFPVWPRLCRLSDAAEGRWSLVDFRQTLPL